MLIEGKIKSNIKIYKTNKRPIIPPPCPKPKNRLIKNINKDNKYSDIYIMVN